MEAPRFHRRRSRLSGPPDRRFETKRPEGLGDPLDDQVDGQQRQDQRQQGLLRGAGWGGTDWEVAGEDEETSVFVRVQHYHIVFWLDVPCDILRRCIYSIFFLGWRSMCPPPEGLELP